MKKRSRQKLVFLLIIIISLLSVLSYINLNNVKEIDNQNRFVSGESYKMYQIYSPQEKGFWTMIAKGPRQAFNSFTASARQDLVKMKSELIQEEEAVNFPFIIIVSITDPNPVENAQVSVEAGSSSFKKDYGMSSAPSWDSYEESLKRGNPLKYFYSLNRDDRSVIKMIPKYGLEEMKSKSIWYDDNYNKQPLSEKEQQWFDSQRGFTPGESDWTVDSWDYGGVLMDEGAKLIYTKSSKEYWTDKSEEERKKIYNSLPLGTYIGYGSAEDKSYAARGSSYNLKKGLHDSSHSAVVVGYAEDGEPIVYDHDKYRRISDHRYSIYGENELTNIIIPKHSLGKDRNYFKNKDLLKKESKELNLDISSLYKFGDKNVLDTFYNSLKENKANLMTDLRIDSKTYDEYAKNLLALAMVETEGGNSPELYFFGSTFGDTHGLTQLNVKNILDDEQLKPIADKYGISDKNDLDDPYKSAIASMIFHKRHQKAANKAYYQGRKGPSVEGKKCPRG